MGCRSHPYAGVSRHLMMGPAAALVAATFVVAGCGWEQELGPRSDTYGGDSTDDGDRADGGDPADDGADDDPAPAEPTTVSGQAATVERVVDGDSIEVTVDGDSIELRLEGYNAPELYTDNPDGTDSQTCNGLAARSAIEDLVARADQVELVDGETDRFGRTLGDLLVDGESLVDQLVADGHGLATGDRADRRSLMIEAASDQRGVWGTGCGEPLTAQLTIGDIQVDPPGNDRNNLAEEFVQLVNVSSRSLDLSGWILRDDTTGHHFPLSGQLEADADLTVITGGQPSDSNVSGAGVLYLGESFPVWSNRWETVILVDPGGLFADWRFVADGSVLDSKPAS